VSGIVALPSAPAVDPFCLVVVPFGESAFPEDGRLLDELSCFPVLPLAPSLGGCVAGGVCAEELFEPSSLPQDTSAIAAVKTRNT